MRVFNTFEILGDELAFIGIESRQERPECGSPNGQGKDREGYPVAGGSPGSFLPWCPQYVRYGIQSTINAVHSTIIGAELRIFIFTMNIRRTSIPGAVLFALSTCGVQGDTRGRRIRNDEATSADALF